MADRRRCFQGSRSGAVFQPADYHPFVPAGLHFAGTGGTALRSAGLHQDLRDGSGCNPLDHAGSGPHGMADPRQDTAGRQQPDQQGADPCLSSGARLGDAASEGDAGHRRTDIRDDAGAFYAAGRRVSPAARRGRSSLHAERASRTFTGGSLGPASADRPPDQNGARSRYRFRQGGPR